MPEMLHQIPVDQIAIAQEGHGWYGSVIITTDGKEHFLAEPLSKVLAWIMIQMSVKRIYQKAGIAAAVLFACFSAFCQPDVQFTITTTTCTNWVCVKTNYVRETNAVTRVLWPERKCARPFEKFPPIPAMLVTNKGATMRQRVLQVGTVEQRLWVITASGTNCVQTNDIDSAILPQRTLTN